MAFATRTCRQAAIISALAVSIACSRDPAPAPPAPVTSQDTSFTLAMVSDPQMYVSYDHLKAAGFPFDASEQFTEHMRYIAQNVESAGGDIAFVSVVGDNWNHQSIRIDPAHEKRGLKWVPNPLMDKNFSPTPKTREIEMPLAKKAFEIIAGEVPFATVPGNHDYDAQWTDSRFPPKLTGPLAPDTAGVLHVGGLDNFRALCGADTPFFRDKPWYVASFEGGAESAQIFEAGGYRFLHLALSFNPPTPSLEWAASVVQKHPGLPTIVTTHEHLQATGAVESNIAMEVSKVDPEDNNLQMVWQKFLSQQDQIFLVLSGHNPGQAHRTDPNQFGQLVYQVMADYQHRWQTAKEVDAKSSRAMASATAGSA